MEGISFIGVLPWWLVAAAVVGATALAVFQFFALRSKLGRRKGLLLASLRVAVYVLVVFFLLAPTLRFRDVRRARLPLTMLIDDSGSMGFPATFAAPSHEGGETRLAAVKRVLLGGEDPLIDRLARGYDLRFFRFDSRLEPLARDAVGRLSARGEGTRLFQALADAQRDGSAGIVLFTDGAANGERQFVDDLAFSQPVFVVGVGDASGLVDIRIAEISAPEIAFRGREIKIEVVIEARGLAGASVPLHLSRGRSLVATRVVAIQSDVFEQRIPLSYTPPDIGPHHLTVAIPIQPGERLPQNNQREFKIDVRRDKIRVLTLSGSPSWNYRFARLALKQDPSIDLVSFIFLRTPTDTVDVPDNRLSLIPFPVDELFAEELKNFDLVWLDDFSYQSYFNTVYLERLREFVRDGGGLAMFGGVRSFDSGGYADSPLAEVLPAELDGKGGFRAGAAWRPRLTAQGRNHPITRLLADDKSNDETWKKLSPLNTLNQIRSAKGETLVEAVRDGSVAPLLTVGRFGKGRTLAFMSDDFWRWNFAAVGAGEGPQNHLKFVRQAVRWLAQEPSLEQVQIQVSSGAPAPGEKLSVKVRVLNDDFTPTAHVALNLRVSGPEGLSTPLETTPAVEPGEYSAEFVPAREGAYRIEAEAVRATRLLGRGRKSFVARLKYNEMEDARPQFDALKQIAQKSRGEFYSVADLGPASLEAITEKLRGRARTEIVEVRQVRVWNTLWTFFLLLALLGAEWWLRRKWGLA
jgi:uncharacterized membrane protein